MEKTLAKAGDVTPRILEYFDLSVPGGLVQSLINRVKLAYVKPFSKPFKQPRITKTILITRHSINKFIKSVNDHI